MSDRHVQELLTKIEIPVGYDIVDFREAKRGESYMASNVFEVHVAEYDFRPGMRRLIVEVSKEQK